MQVTAEGYQGCRISSLSAIAHIAATFVQQLDGESSTTTRAAGKIGQVDVKDFTGIKPPSSDFALWASCSYCILEQPEIGSRFDCSCVAILIKRDTEPQAQSIPDRTGISPAEKCAEKQRSMKVPV